MANDFLELEEYAKKHGIKYKRLKGQELKDAHKSMCRSLEKILPEALKGDEGS